MATMVGRPGRADMTIGSVLSRSFSVLGTAPLVFFGTSLVLTAVPYALFMTIVRSVAPQAPGFAPFTAAWPMVLASGAVWWLLYLVTKAVLIRATVAELNGPPATIGGHFSAAMRVLLPMVVLSILTSLALMVGFLLLIVPGIILYLVWAVTTPALVVERQGVFAAFGRSARLTRGARWRILGLSLVVWVIYFLAAGVFGVLGVMARNVAPGAPTLVQTVSSVVLQTGFFAVWTAIQATLYAELRDEKDGPAGERLADIFA